MRITPNVSAGLVALVLSFAVGVSLVAISVSAAVTEARRASSVSEQAATLLSTALGAAIGAVATYIGSTIRHDGGDDELEDGGE